jgi:hypothetical protein
VWWNLSTGNRHVAIEAHLMQRVLRDTCSHQRRTRAKLATARAGRPAAALINPALIDAWRSKPGPTVGPPV